jgi:hypothetical protein
MPKFDAIFEEQYMYTDGSGNLSHGFNVYLTDVFGKYIITPIKKNGSSGFHYAVDIIYTYNYSVGDYLIFKSKKKAMQYVVAKLFTDEFDYEHYGFTKYSRIYV